MRKNEEVAAFKRRAMVARNIALDILNDQDRKTLMQFINDCEKMAETARAARANSAAKV